MATPGETAAHLAVLARRLAGRDARRHGRAGCRRRSVVAGGRRRRLALPGAVLIHLGDLVERDGLRAVAAAVGASAALLAVTERAEAGSGVVVWPGEIGAEVEARQSFGEAYVPVEHGVGTGGADARAVLCVDDTVRRLVVVDVRHRHARSLCATTHTDVKKRSNKNFKNVQKRKNATKIENVRKRNKKRYLFLV